MTLAVSWIPLADACLRYVNPVGFRRKASPQVQGRRSVFGLNGLHIKVGHQEAAEQIPEHFGQELSQNVIQR
jgi:hypothetical protein